MMGLTLTSLRRRRGESDVDRLRALVLRATRNAAERVAAAERETAFAWATVRETARVLESVQATARQTRDQLVRAQRRVRVLEGETARQSRLIERLERDLLLARGMPALSDQLGGTA